MRPAAEVQPRESQHLSTPAPAPPPAPRQNTHLLQLRGPHQPGKAQHRDEGVELRVALVQGEPAAEALRGLGRGGGGRRVGGVEGGQA